VGYLMPLFYFGWSILRGKRAPSNPWHAKGLEWATTSPPPKDNFDTMPEVPAVPYDYDPREAPA
jgi:cytochrome c oxidase subunit 1